MQPTDQRWSQHSPRHASSYDGISNLYDDLFGAFDEDLPFWRQFADPTARVCEIGAGTGRVTKELVAAEVVVGVDPSLAMLGAARTKMEGYSNVELREGRAQAIPASNGEFTVVVMPRGAMSHLINLEEQQQALCECARVLQPGGTLVIDVPRYDAIALSRLTKSRASLAKHRTSRGSLVVRIVTSLDSLNNVISFTEELRLHTGRGRSEVGRAQWFTKAFTPAELVLLLVGAGFQIESVEGDYNGAPLSRTSERIMIRARRS